VNTEGQLLLAYTVGRQEPANFSVRAIDFYPSNVVSICSSRWQIKQFLLLLLFLSPLQ